MATYTFAAVGAGPVGDLYDPLHRLMGAGHLAAATSFMALRVREPCELCCFAIGGSP